MAAVAAVAAHGFARPVGQHVERGVAYARREAGEVEGQLAADDQLFEELGGAFGSQCDFER
jgi:hypothetical protein